jgi:hypothetical protein
MTTIDPDSGDIAIRQGNNFPPIRWQFLSSENPDVLFPIDGKSFQLTITWAGGTIEHGTSDAAPVLLIDTESSTVTWNYTVNESRQIPLGRIARYDLEARGLVGSTQSTWIAARVVVEEGINTDV